MPKPASLQSNSGVSAAPLPGLASSAASRLPRWAIAWLLALYILQGLFHRDPWRGDDLVGIALARSAAESLLKGDFSLFFIPHIQGLTFHEEGPLWPLIQAIFMLPIYAWSWVTKTPLAVTLLDDAARIPLAIAMAVGFIALWKAADRFARRREAQPIDPLGVGPKSEDFGKTIGDCAFLIAVACLGTIYPWHQSGTQAAVFALHSLLLWTLATAPEFPKRAARHSAWLLMGMLLIDGLGLAVTFVFALLLIFWLVKPYRLVAGIFFRKFFALFLVFLVVVILLSVALTDRSLLGAWVQTQSSDWWIAKMIDAQAGGFAHLRRWFLDALWKWWPLWPIALFGLWRNRQIRFLEAPQWAAPLIITCCMLAAGLLGPREWQLAQLAPIASLALLAAFGLLTMPRPLVNLVDWFAVVLFTGLAIFIWLYWTALNFGFPQNLANRVALVAPGIEGNANIYEISIGISATIAWLVLVSWRIGRGNPRLWRPVILSAGGLTLVWTLLITLWIPAIDRIQGQATLARSMERAWMASATKIYGPSASPKALSAQHADACVMASRTTLGPTAAAVALTQIPIRLSDQCRWRFALRDAETASASTAAPKGQWKVIWQSKSSEDRRSKERYLLLERVR